MGEGFSRLSPVCLRCQTARNLNRVETEIAEYTLLVDVIKWSDYYKK
jgi:hypothetical protein